LKEGAAVRTKADPPASQKDDNFKTQKDGNFRTHKDDNFKSRRRTTLNGEG
jgi:hypothetical protein